MPGWVCECSNTAALQELLKLGGHSSIVQGRRQASGRAEDVSFNAYTSATRLKIT